MIEEIQSNKVHPSPTIAPATPNYQAKIFNCGKSRCIINDNCGRESLKSCTSNRSRESIFVCYKDAITIQAEMEMKEAPCLGTNH